MAQPPTIKIDDKRTNEECRADSHVNNGQRFTSFSQLASYGVKIDRSKGWDAAPEGELVWVCTGFFVRPGIPAIGVHVDDANGNPFGPGEVAVAHSWPGAPKLDGEPMIPDFSEDRNHGGVKGWTNENGEAWFAIREYIPAGGSQFRQWIMLPGPGRTPYYTDMVEGCGQWGGTNHTTVSPMFQLMRKPGDSTPPPQPPPNNGGGEIPLSGDLFLAVVIDGRIVEQVELPDLAPGSDMQLFLVSKLGDFQV